MGKPLCLSVPSVLLSFKDSGFEQDLLPQKNTAAAEAMAGQEEHLDKNLHCFVSL
jgi:hypothetical protein